MRNIWDLVKVKAKDDSSKKRSRRVRQETESRNVQKNRKRNVQKKKKVDAIERWSVKGFLAR